MVGWSIGSALTCALYVVAIRRASGSWSGTVAGQEVMSSAGLHRSILAYSLPLFVWSVLATGTLYVDRLVLASVANLASVGVYNYASTS